ncbi:MAG: hypothetical protein J6X66_04990 [Lachnospiraceae bacterium]|nr:hypothetical protein [Lachnospiraceae bacterium]
MGFFQKLKEKWHKWFFGDYEEDEEEWDEKSLEEDKPVSSRGAGYFNDADTRTVYVLEALQQMSEAAGKVEQYQSEYDAVTALLKDTEEIDSLVGDMKDNISSQAQRIEKLEKERRKAYEDAGILDEYRLELLKRYEEGSPAAIEKMKEAEGYRRLVKMDLRKMEAEKASNRYQMREAVVTLSNSRGVAVIIAVAVIFAILLLAVLQYAFGMDVSWGYMMTGGAGAIALTVMFVKYQDAAKEIKLLQKARDKIIVLHNTVKIRYVNNTNLLSYMYTKYDVDSSKDLEADWADYIEVTNAKIKDERLRQDLEYYYEKLTDTLRKCGIKDPEIWTRQVKALVDPREMVEVRHALIGRRGKLREHLEYNKQITGRAQDKIKDLVMAYPQYADEVEGIVKRYDAN